MQILIIHLFICLQFLVQQKKEMTRHLNLVISYCYLIIRNIVSCKMKIIYRTYSMYHFSLSHEVVFPRKVNLKNPKNLFSNEKITIRDHLCFINSFSYDYSCSSWSCRFDNITTVYVLYWLFLLVY